MSEGILQLLFQLHPVLPHISIHHLDSFVGQFWAVVSELSDNILGRQVGPGSRSEGVVSLAEFSDVCLSKEWCAHVPQFLHQVMHLRDGEGTGLDELPLIMYVIGGGIGRRPSAGGGSGLA
jgi:hypothetical protein